MDTAGGIRKHLEHVVFLARIAVIGLEDLLFVPFLLPAGLGIARVITFGSHRIRISGKSWEVGADLHHETTVASSFAAAVSARSPLPDDNFEAVGLGKHKAGV